MVCDCVSIWVCVCVCAWRETTWQALHFSANADLSVYCWQIQTSPVPPLIPNVKPRPLQPPPSARAAFLTPFLPLSPREIRVLLAPRGRESERGKHFVLVRPLRRPSHHQPDMFTPLTIKSFLWISRLNLYPHHAKSDDNQHTKKSPSLNENRNLPQ